MEKKTQEHLNALKTGCRNNTQLYLLYHCWMALHIANIVTEKTWDTGDITDLPSPPDSSFVSLKDSSPEEGQFEDAEDFFPE